MSILCDLKDCSPPGSSVHGILQARILEWVAMPPSRGSSGPKDQTHISYISCIGSGFFFWEAPLFKDINPITDVLPFQSHLNLISSQRSHLQYCYIGIKALTKKKRAKTFSPFHWLLHYLVTYWLLQYKILLVTSLINVSNDIFDNFDILSLL